MVICPNCGYANENYSRFCSRCGVSLEVFENPKPVTSGEFTEEVGYPGQGSETFTEVKEVYEIPKEENTEKLMEDLGKYTTASTKISADDIKAVGTKISGLFKKIGKKTVIICSVVLILIVVAAIFVIPYAPHYTDGNEAMETGDYKKAIAEYEKAGNFFDAKEKLSDAHFKRGEELYEKHIYLGASNEFEATSRKDKDKKIMDCGEQLVDEGKYEEAQEVFAKLDTEASENMGNYAEAKYLFEESKYEEAKEKFEDAGNVRDSATLRIACDLLEAEKSALAGGFTTALTHYKLVPENFEYEGISAKSRIALIENSPVISAAGSWEATSSHSRSSSSSRYWYLDKVVPGVSLYFSVKLNPAGNFDVSGTVKFTLLPFYEEIKDEKTPSKIETKVFQIKGITEIPSSYKLDDNTTLTYSGGVFKLRYSDSDAKGYTRLVNVTYEKK